MRKRVLNLFLVVVLMLGMLPMTWAPQPTMAAPPVSFAATEPASVVGARQAPPHLEEVPAEIQALFAEGMSVEEFVQMAGYVPKALEGLVEGDALMIIELEGAPLAVYYAEQRDAGRAMSTNAIESYVQNLKTMQAQLQSRLESLDVQVISNYTTVYNGMQALVPLSRLNEIRALPGVKAVHRAPIHEPALAASVPLIGAPEVWEDLGYDGEGVVIAIIDTGIDYTHAAFGGSGDPADYANNNPDIVERGTFPTPKVIAGYDFAGTKYHAGCSPADEAAGICSRIPKPDLDPLDEHGHGTHVASTAAGLATDKVSAGVAPAAKLVALKVFGRSGSTALTLDALDWAANHYLIHGWPQVINMSLGSNFGTNDLSDPSIDGTQNAAAVGIVVVASAGNAGNHSYITGSPATADKAISVAASTTGYVTGPTINISGTTYVTQTNIVYQIASFANGTGHFTDEVVAPLAYVANLTGAPNNQLCTTTGITPTNALAGQVALIQRGGCTFAAKVNNAAALGAVAAIIYNNTTGILGMTGDPVAIPAGSIQMQDGINLIPAHGQTMIISAEDDVSTVPDPYTPADTIATFSSRGPRGYDSALKPEITAPGVGIFAADMGSGSGGVSMSGTSMAAPHVAGVAALMVQAYPDWTPEAIKAALMNTAIPAVGGATIPRHGAGRVNAYRAVETGVYAVGRDDLVSLSWGVPMSRNDTVTRVTQVTVYNEKDEQVAYDTGWMFQAGSRTAGATLTVEPARIVIAPGASAVVTVTLSLDMTQIPVVYGTAGVEEYYGYIVLTPPPPYLIYLPLVMKEGGPATMATPTSVGASATLMDDSLVVPFYFQPRPYSQLETIVGDGVIADPATDSAIFEITHRGPITSSLWVYPALAWNEDPDPDMAGPGDIRMFGMDYGWTHGTLGDIMIAAINAHGYWHVPQPFFAEFDLYIDADQDGVADYVNFNYNYGWLQGAGHTNQWIVVQVDLATGTLYLGSPWVIYTDYNASFMEWYLPAAYQDLGPANSTFDYQLFGFDGGGVSMTPPGQFDYRNYPFGWDISNDPGPADRAAEIEVWVNSQVGYYYSSPLGVMIVDYNGDPRNVNGGQAYFKPIEVETLHILDLTLLHTNDFHARVDQYNRNGARCKPADEAGGLCIAGVARLATVVEGIRAARDHVLFLDAGDQFQGSLFFTVFGADVLTATMTALGYDAMAIGNHEFDSGPAELARFIDGVEFPVIGSNIDASAEPLLDGKILPYTILERGGQQIGIIGLTTPDTENISSPGPNIIFTPVITAAQETVDLLTNMGVDKIVALTHLGYEADLELAAVVSGIDIIIGGHSHSFLYDPPNPISFSPPTFPQFGPLVPVGPYPTVIASPAAEPVLVVTAYQWGTFLGRLDVVFDEHGIVTYFGGNPIFLGNNVARDPDLEALLDEYRPAVAALIATPVGTTTVDLPIVVGGQQICRLGECRLGNLVADAMLWMANQVDPAGNYQIAFQNGGGLRAPIVAGTVTMGDVLETLPFGNAIATFQLEGTYIKAALENGARLYPSANGGFAQVSGLRYTINASQPAGSRVSNIEVWNGTSWEPLVLTQIYNVVTNDFMRRGGDNYTMFRDHAINPYDFGPALDEALAQYFMTFSPVTPVIEGRIIINP